MLRTRRAYRVVLNVLAVVSNIKVHLLPSAMNRTLYGESLLGRLFRYLLRSNRPGLSVLLLPYHKLFAMFVTHHDLYYQRYFISER